MEIIKVNKSASAGIVMGKCFIAEKPDLIVNNNLNENQEVALNKITNAIKQATNQIIKLAEKSDIFASHLEIINDPMLLDLINQNIKNNQNSEESLHNATLEITKMFESIEDEYIAARVDDIKDISTRIMCHLKKVSYNIFDNIQEDTIVFTNNLNPSDTTNMNFNKIKGFVTEVGGITGHIVIIAKQKEIPCIVGLKNILNKVKNNDYIILDCLENNIIINPTEDQIQYYKEKITEYNEKKYQMELLLDKETKTLDGHKVKLYANIGSYDDCKIAIENKAEGIGLFRTEFLYINNTNFATEEQQFNEYKKCVENNNHEVIIRTLDIGGDKTLPYYKFDHEENPFLGHRAIRFCLDNIEEVFKPQLKAILRASAYGNIKIMYPMITSIEEYLKANEILQQCKDELKQNNIKYNENIETGVMIETPSSVMICHQLSKIVDFFSIGTNDLTQYMLCVDRTNQKIEHLYNPLHNSVLLSIKQVVDAAHAYGKIVGVCGELASDKQAIKTLIALGVDELSVTSVLIKEVKYEILNMNYQEEQKKLKI